MATSSVRTVEEFITAVGKDSEEVILLSDLDFNEYFTSDNAKIINVTCDTIRSEDPDNPKKLYNCQCTEKNDNGAFIIGLNNSRRVAISYVQFNNIYTTLYANGALFRGNNSNMAISFLGCSFQGKCGSIISNATSATTVNQCTFSIEECRINDQDFIHANSGSKINNSYFDFKNCYFSSNAEVASPFSTQYTQITTSYFTGNIDLIKTNAGTKTFSLGSSINSCVVNIDLRCTSGTGAISLSGVTNASISVVNNDKIGEGMTKGVDNTYVKYISDSNMRNATYLKSIGFDIV